MKINNYEDMLTASKTIKKIADEAVATGTKVLQEVQTTALDKMCEYLYQTLKPTFDSPIGNFGFRLYNASGIQLYKGQEFCGQKKFKAQLRNSSLDLIVHFTDDGYEIGGARPESVLNLIKYWHELKESLDNEIKSAILNYNKRREKEVERLAHLSQVFEEFEV